jgi:hypothetical protein
MRDPLYKRAVMRLTTWLDRRYGWQRLPFPLAIVTLIGLRMSLRRQNLYDTTGVTVGWGPELSLSPTRSKVRSVDGSGTDPNHPEMGAAGTRFGRNVPPSATYTQRVDDPNPRTVSEKLLRRERFHPATTLNVLVAAWIQFEVHDWMSHGDNQQGNPYLIEVEDAEWPYERPMQIDRTAADPTAPPQGGAPTFVNTETHWWDASQVYGSTMEIATLLRTHVGGHLHLSPDGVIPFDPPRMEIPGANLGAVKGNWWLGLAMMHTLFMREHNAICDHLARAYPSKSDQELYDLARLVNAALIARIHTLDWTPALLADTDLEFGMQVNWWGIQGERLHDWVGRLTTSEEFSGIPGSELYYHGVPFSMTEEFLAIYRMHPLIPDEFSIRDWRDDAEKLGCELHDLLGLQTHGVLTSPELTMEDFFYSFGTSHPGALRLHNYPNNLRRFPNPDGVRHFDLAAVDILRDRERGVPTYNEFRRLFRLRPAATFEELAGGDTRTADELREVYRSVEDVDLMVGCFVERAPEGFAISDTAFRVFILMASRRLKSDRFYTTDFNDETYTPEGMAWIEHNDMRSVLLRHYPALGPALEGVRNAFTPWHRAAR